MRVAFHFDAVHTSLVSGYGEKILRRMFSVLGQKHGLTIDSLISSGDFALRDLCEVEETIPDGVMSRSDQETFVLALCRWLNEPDFAWRTFTGESLEVIKRGNVFVVFFESIDITQARYVDHALWKIPYYIGAMEVSHRSPVNTAIYET